MPYRVSGSVVNGAGSPVAAMVAVYDRATGELIGRVDSGADGNYDLDTPNANPVFVVRFCAPVIAEADPFVFAPGTPTDNAEIYDNVIPVEYTAEPPAPL